MNIALFQNKYDEMAKRVLVDEYMKPVDEKENAFAERQSTISKINGMVDEIGFMEGAIRLQGKFLGIGDVIGYALPDPVREVMSSFYYVDKIPAYKEKELFTQYGQEETVDKIAHTVSRQRELHSDNEVLGIMEKAMDMPQYSLLDDKDFNIVHGRTWTSEEELLAMIKEGKTDFAVASDFESFYVHWYIIEETLKNADLTADDVFGEVPDQYLAKVKGNLEGEATPNFNSVERYKYLVSTEFRVDGNDNHNKYYEARKNDDGSIDVRCGRVGKSEQTHHYTRYEIDFDDLIWLKKTRDGYKEISDILDDISASNLHLSFDLETQDGKDFGCYNRLFAVVTDAGGFQALYRLPVLVNDETGELETLSDVCKKVQLYCSRINDDECWIKVADSDDIFNRAITDLSFKDDRRELQVEITNFTAYEYSPVQQKEQEETLRVTQSEMTCITMQDLENEGFVNMLKNKHNNNIPR